ncbi:MAG: ATP-binding cassette domain-containing protein [Oscillospiraceae bacterium]|jgi:AbrB family looped-hinge helix DNA binding protein|nr:ATP-binding cassette domain-containing protein [Oscillospiraceae bacterium]
MPKKVLLAPPENVMVRCDNLVKIYKKKGGKRFPSVEVMALQGLDLTVNRGELIGIVGSSGSGKSTLLNLLGGLDVPTAGSLFVDGRDMLKFGDEELTRYKRVSVGFVWQNSARNLVPYLTVLQNAELPLLLSGFGDDRRRRAEESLEMAGISHKKGSLPGQLSGGEQQRAAIAVALSGNPKLLLADEPTGSVDSKTAKSVLEAFRALNRKTGVTVIIVTHDVNLSKEIDRVVAIRDGKTSSEFIRKKIDAVSLEELAGAESAPPEIGGAHEELAVFDRAGRLQIPKEYLASLGIKGGDKVKVELDGDRIIILPRNP